MESRYELYVSEANRIGFQGYMMDIKGNGSFEYRDVVLQLMELENKLNLNLFQYLFGEELGMHYASVFFNDANRSILKFMGKMESEKMFFLLHQLKTNKALYAYC